MWPHIFKVYVLLFIFIMGSPLPKVYMYLLCMNVYLVYLTSVYIFFVPLVYLGNHFYDVLMYLQRPEFVPLRVHTVLVPTYLRTFGPSDLRYICMHDLITYDYFFYHLLNKSPYIFLEYQDDIIVNVLNIVE